MRKGHVTSFNPFSHGNVVEGTNYGAFSNIRIAYYLKVNVMDQIRTGAIIELYL